MADQPTDKPTLAEFLAALEEQCADSPNALTESIVRELAEHIPEEERTAVLDAIRAANPDADLQLTRTPVPDSPPESLDFELANQVNQFVRRLEDGKFFQELAWDEEQSAERSYGDESWALEMDEFFGRASSTYLSGNNPLAAYVYGRLLNAFRYADRPGIFCGPLPPEEMIQTDLNEAKRRYFRAMYEVSAPQERAQCMLALMETLRSVGGQDVGLAEVATMDGQPSLPDRDVFLPLWIEALKAVDADQKGWGRCARKLLREAVTMNGQADGLCALAYEEGAEHPEVYHDWVGVLVQQNRLQEAIEAAREGIQRIQDLSYRARLADRLALLAHTTHDVALAVEATRSAWRSAPTVVRLLLMVAAAERAGVTSVALEQESQGIRRGDWTHSDGLACHLLLLAGHYDDAIARFEQADAMGWGRAKHPGALVLSFLLFAVTGEERLIDGTAIAALLAEFDAPERGYFDRRLLLDRLNTGGDTGRHPFDQHQPYSELLLAALQSHPVPERSRRKWLAIARNRIQNTTREVLEGQHRRGESMAAQWTIALAEALSVVESEEDALTFVADVRAQYGDYSVLMRTLDELQLESPLLPDAEGNRPSPNLVLVKS